MARRRTRTQAEQRRTARRGPAAVRPADREAGDRRQLREAEPADAAAQPGDLRRRGRLASSSRSGSSPTSSSGGPVAFDTAIALGLWFTVLFANFAEAMAEGRGKAQAESAPPDPGRPRRAAARARTAPRRPSRPRDLRAGDLVMVVGRRADPRRRRDRRGDRLGRRVGDHRRVRAGDPRVRRRPLGRHRRHQGAVGLDQGADHGRARRRRSSTG